MKDNLQNLKKYASKLQDVLQRSVVLGAVGTHLQAKMSNTELILIHEFGSRKRNLPARAPIRKTFNSKDVANRLAKNFFHSVITILESGGNPNDALEFIGQSMVLEIQKTFNEGLTPPLKKKYLEKKVALGYSNLPLIKTEQLINSFSYEIRE